MQMGLYTAKLHLGVELRTFIGYHIGFSLGDEVRPEGYTSPSNMAVAVSNYGH